MDRTHSRPRRPVTNKARRANEKRPVSAARLRFITAGVALACLAGLILLTGGSTAQRLMQIALPLLRGLPQGEVAPAQPSAAPISITRVDIDEGVSESVRIEVLSPKAPVVTPLGGDEPRILIYHTHTTEAYAMTDDYQYTQSGDARTHEHDKSIVAVGALLAKILSEQYGCNVIHDTTDHEPPKLRTSYNRSEETMKAYQAQYPSLTMFIDVHRDAGDRSTVLIDGKSVAKMMFVVGTGEGATGTGFAQMPDFESNFALANAITENLRQVNAALMRNIRVKTSRYNQHISNQCLLVEMGNHGNTLQDALNAVPYLAAAIVEVMGGEAEASAALATPAPEASPGALWAPSDN